MPSIMVAYSTLSGHNFELAQEIIHQLNHLHLATRCLEADLLTQADLTNSRALIVCPATYGAGTVADGARQFYSGLTSLPLSGLPFWVAGIGDRGYGPTDFCGAVTLFDRRLVQQGGTRLAPALKIDYQLTPAGQQQVESHLATIKEHL